MKDTVITVNNLSKSYLIGHNNSNPAKYTTLRNAVEKNVRRYGQQLLSAIKGESYVQGDEIEEFWALKDITLDIKQGDVTGIIGRNGAGKSTLLKTLCQITEPTTGRISLRGRVASLLEVGTGFHQELTGRENIFLNGAILGMTRKEIRLKFEEIVEFSGVEKFLDTPVKRYSSGMYVRLAFAVASHLEPDILIVDEVLAVGDMDFQKKCLGRMNEVSQQGRTVLFVSHNLPMISSLCNQCILLDAGKLVASGPTEDVIPLYHGASFTQTKDTNTNFALRDKAKPVELCSAWISNGDNINVDKLSIFEDVYLHVIYSISEDLNEAVIPFFHLLDEKGEYILLTFPHDWAPETGRELGKYEAICHIPAHLLNDGSYSVSIQVNTVNNGHTLSFFEHHALRFTIFDSIHNNPYRDHIKYSYEIPGAVRPLLDWELKPAEH